MSKGYFISHFTSAIWVSSWVRVPDQGQMVSYGSENFAHLLLTPWWIPLMNSSFTYFLLTLPISHFFISLLLVFSLLFIFSSISALTKKLFWLFQHLSYVSHHKHSCIVFYQPICDLAGYIFCQAISRWPCECPYIDTMFLSQPHLFPVQNLPFIFQYRFVVNAVPPHAGYK